jgi:hypothetical protein
MTVVNFACWLARRSAGASRVLIIDWDLEAPGLQRFFPESEAREGAQRDGLINYFEAIRTGFDSDSTIYDRIASDTGPDVLRAAFPLDAYLMRDVVPGVDLLRAGRLDADYARLVSSFNWIQFHEKYPRVFPALRAMIASAYQYCLIDSRTGFNDVSGVCTMLMAEKLVLVFTPNRQSLSGVLDLAARAVSYRRSSDDFRPLAIFPLPSRIENAELDLKQQWRKRYQEEFEGTLATIYQLDGCDLGAYFDDVLLPHVSYYSYGEEIAVLRESSADALSLSRAYETFFRRLDDMEFAWDTHAEASGAPAPAPRFTAADLAADDVYISYAHVDNLSVTGQSQGWIDILHRTLTIRLEQLVGRPVRVWRDDRLAAGDAFNEASVHRIRKAGLFIAIVSPAFVRSDYCQRELDAFLTRGDGGSAPLLGQLCKVLKAPVPLNDQPPALRAVLGYEFFKIDPSSGRVRELSYDGAPENQRDYFLKVDDLAYDFAKSQELVEVHSGALAAEAAPVYLAVTTRDLQDERESILRDLAQHGYHVLPRVPLPLEVAELEQTVREQLARCRMSIHLIGRNLSLVPTGGVRSLLEMQADLADERAASDPSFTRIIWTPRNLEGASPTQRDFIAKLESRVARGTDMLEGSIEELKTLLSSRLKRDAPRAMPSAVAATAPMVYAIVHPNDADAANEIHGFLFERDLDVTMSLWEGDPAELRAYHEESLDMCAAVLIYYGTTTEVWLRRQILDAQRAMSRRSKQRPTMAVLLGPPASESKTRFRTHSVNFVLDATTQPAVEVLKPFVDAIVTSGS